MLNEQISNLLKDKICIAESKLLKTIGFDFDTILPYEYLDNVIKKFVPNDISEMIFYTSKVHFFKFYKFQAFFL